MGDLSSPESKLSWIFTAFDADGGGTIDAQEIRSQMLKIDKWPKCSCDEKDDF